MCPFLMPKSCKESQFFRAEFFRAELPPISKETGDHGRTQKAQAVEAASGSHDYITPVPETQIWQREKKRMIISNFACE